MKDMQSKTIHRVLIVDDNPNIHKDFQTILLDEQENTTLDELRAEVFGEEITESQPRGIYELDFASQGKAGLEKVRDACLQNKPYKLVFVDMRMPPGWDGLKTIEHIWQVDSKIQVVICTAYSDYSWAEISQRLGRSENLLILKKPFDSAEVSQLAVALTKKWDLAKQASLKMEQLEQMVAEQTEQLVETNNQLKQEIAEREKAELNLAKLVKKVDNTNRELNDFASIVSHDLKTPLRGIKTLATWILESCADKFDDEARDQMELLLSRVERLHELIGGVLQYSQIGRVEGEQTRLKLNEFIPEVIDMLMPPKNIEISIESELPVIEGQETHIMQLFQNLLSNSIKYMDKPKGWVKIDCVDDGDFWKFSVADNGPGIAQKDFEKIFKMFRRASVTDKASGTGVGLTVAAKIIQLYGGKIWVESELGKGSTFYFILPKTRQQVPDKILQTNIIC